ncbi:MAG: serine hydrolase domain-containing protein [Caulobacteraceae bacterium]
MRLGLILALVSLWSSTAAATPSDGYIARARDFVAALNAGDDATIERFRDQDAAPALVDDWGAGGIRFWFLDHHRATGGVEFIAARPRATDPDIVEVIVRGRVYGALHGYALTLDGQLDGRIADMEPTDATPAWAIAHDRTLSAADVAARARALIDRGCRAGVFSGAALVAFRDRVLVQQACGQASLRYDAPNNVDTRFNLGSMNKMFTAVAIMQLVGAGKVALTDPLSKYADDSWLPRDISSRITIEQLLTHTSGLGSFFDDGLVASSRAQYRELADYKPLVRTEKLAFPPGTRFHYSDTGFLMLGVVVEKASGESYFDYVRRHIYAPAGMTATDSYPMNEPVPNLATGYGWYSKGPYHWRENTFDHLFRGGPAGGGFSTVGDLLKFARALQAGKLVSPASLRFLWTDHPPHNYGAGFEIVPTAAGPSVGHSGHFEGISTRLSILRDRGWVVVVLSNIDDGAPGLVDAITDEIARSR